MTHADTSVASIGALDTALAEDTATVLQVLQLAVWGGEYASGTVRDHSAPTKDNEIEGAPGCASAGTVGVSAAGDGRNDRDLRAIGYRGVDAVEITDVIVGHEDVHKSP